MNVFFENPVKWMRVAAIVLIVLGTILAIVRKNEAAGIAFMLLPFALIFICFDDKLMAPIVGTSSKKRKNRQDVTRDNRKRVVIVARARGSDY
jgi:hypothetical protein